MKSRSNVTDGKRKPRTAQRRRGSVLPFVAIGLPVIFALIACSLDLGRNIAAVRKIEFAADAAALYASSMGTNSDGSYDATTARTNMLSALAQASQSATGAAWNNAPAGPVNGKTWQTDVTFSDSDLLLVPNPLDANENFVQVTARRDGSNALQQYFGPAFNGFAALTGQAGQAQQTVSPYRISEVIGQPVSRVGAAAPRTGATVNVQLLPYAVFPLAISNQQFQAATSPSNGNSTFNISLVTSSNVAAGVSGNQMKACFVNVAPSLDSSQTYGTGQGNLALDQLNGMFKYFYNAPDATAVLPAAVERGGTLAAFNPLDATFASRKQSIVSAFGKVQLGEWLILPVIAADPNFGGPNTVVGFARMQLVQAVNTASNDFNIVLKIDQHPVPLRNVASDSFHTIPQFDGTVLPAPVAPFLPRAYDAGSNGITACPRGLALAPAISPRPAAR